MELCSVLGNMRTRGESLENGRVTFEWKDYARRSRTQTMTLDAVEFMRRPAARSGEQSRNPEAKVIVLRCHFCRASEESPRIQMVRVLARKLVVEDQNTASAKDYS
jgi:putative transposase